jgi:hypothetical protein
MYFCGRLVVEVTFEDIGVFDAELAYLSIGNLFSSGRNKF